ncbi:MAG: PilZ domain-containing protein [Paracoccaceae bacterium]|nr:PilZ domain-containing protein [Paracoccaceae bacterium]
MEYRPNRRVTDVPATLILDVAEHPTMIRDISRDGARVSTDGPLAPGTAVRLRIDDKDFMALVHWSEDGEAGLRFFDRLDSATLLILESVRDDFAPFR